MNAGIFKPFILILSVLMAFTSHVNAQEVEWISFEEAVKRNEQEPRKILVDIYTDWCGWCKKMDRDAYANEKLASYINENYYAVKFNAEQREDVVFNGNTFKFVPNGNRGVHQLAAALTNNKLSYPTTVFLTEELEIIQPIPGYMDAKSIEPILTFFGDNAFKETAWPKYQKEFKSSL